MENYVLFIYFEVRNYTNFFVGDAVVEKLHYLVIGNSTHLYIHTYPGRLIAVNFHEGVGQFKLRQYDG